MCNRCTTTDRRVSIKYLLLWWSSSLAVMWQHVDFSSNVRPNNFTSLRNCGGLAPKKRQGWKLLILLWTCIAPVWENWSTAPPDLLQSARSLSTQHAPKRAVQLKFIHLKAAGDGLYSVIDGICKERHGEITSMHDTFLLGEVPGTPRGRRAGLLLCQWRGVSGLCGACKSCIFYRLKKSARCLAFSSLMRDSIVDLIFRNPIWNCESNFSFCRYHLKQTLTLFSNSLDIQLVREDDL